ncbi:WD40 repeat domain-containing serine/threonine-protein kinase [Prosthecobacter sp.]|uniref:WD40 repeat domain-containing serine/threonine protein kinase n=1 Tax=Prosthecobacter sp. TaxID=1965333 RepID=UPI002ABB6EAA|nr:WD40 repeat domain-containing serine/threonine-protein kinase [Prosthecobacter sp.]MDZ4404882.1 WD40 repeat domain-containing serine/threonine-protein kinase [Prosthecobacter sp.]
MPADSPDPSPPPLGAENYQLGPEISSGGMGSVLEAKDAKLDRTVAIKVMLLEANADARMRQRFLREAQVLAKLAHPNIVPIYDIVWEDGMPLFYSMKLVKGRTLQAILLDLRKGVPETLRDYSLDRLLTIFRKVCDAIAFAHSQGVLHRDLKPDNIMVGEFGEVLVMDWGLAKIKAESEKQKAEMDAAQQPDSISVFDFPISAFSKTLHGSVLGTPQYMSPEQARGSLAEVDELSDIYALGGILYAILTLRPPVEGATALEVLERVSKGEITAPTAFQSRSGSRGKAFEKGDVLEAKLIKPLPHIRGGRVPSALSSVAMKALQLDKANRYPSVIALSADIEAYSTGFATSSEQAGALRQLQLLMLRHKVVTASLAALLLISLGFVWKVMASERRAQHSLATAQIALADVALKEGDVTRMTSALEVVPTALRDQSWHYLAAKHDSSLGPLMIPGFCEQVTDVCAVGNAAAQFAIASRDGRIGIVDVVSKKLLRTLDTGHAGELRLSISADGKRLLARTSSASEAALYDLATGEKLKTFAVSHSDAAAHPYLQTLALNATGTLAAIADFDTEALHLIETATGVVRWTKPFRPLRMVFASHGHALALVQHQDYVLHGLKLTDGSPAFLGRLNAHPNSMAANPDHARIVIGLISGDVEVYHSNNGLLIKRQRVAAMPIAQVAYSAGRNIITLGGSSSQSLAVSRALSFWHPGDLAPNGVFHGITAYTGDLPLSVNHTSGHLLTQQSPPQIWHFPDQPLAEMLPGGDEGWSCHFLSDTELLARGEKAFATLFDVSDPRKPITMPASIGEKHPVSAVHLATGLIATAYSRNSLTTPGSALSLWQTTKDGVTEKWSRPAEVNNDNTMHLDFDAQGERLLRTTPQPHNHLIIHDTRTGDVLHDFKREAYKAIFAGTHGHIIAISSELQPNNTQKGNIAILDPRDGRILASLDHGSAFYALAASPDRRLIAVGGSDRFVMILDADTLALKHRFRAHDASITAIRFHPTQPLLATGSTDHSLKLWRYTDATLLQTFTAIEGLPRSLTFSPNGRLLATDGRDRAVRVFELETSK